MSPTSYTYIYFNTCKSMQNALFFIHFTVPAPKIPEGMLIETHYKSAFKWFHALDEAIPVLLEFTFNRETVVSSASMKKKSENKNKIAKKNSSNGVKQCF